MSMKLDWRRLNFFDKNAVLDPKSSGRFDGLQKVQMCCWAVSPDGEAALIGESTGAVFCLDKQLGVRYWKAYQATLSHLAVVGGLVITIGEDERDVNTTLKIWSRTENFVPSVEVDASPPIQRTLRLCGFRGLEGVRGTCVASHSSQRILAVGHADGSVLLYSGDYVNDRGADKEKKWIRLRESAPLEGEVTGLAIAALSTPRDAENGPHFAVFVLTPKSLHSFVIDIKGGILNKLKHDAAGASRDCFSFSEQTNQFVVATRDAVHFYDADNCRDPEGAHGRIHALGRGYEKTQIATCGEHLAILTKQAALIKTPEQDCMTIITVYDVKGQYVAFTCSFPSSASLFVLNGQFMIFGHDHFLYTLTQKNLNAKLDILYKMNVYDVAIGIAKRSEGGEKVLPSIHAKFADYLYGKGDFENAILHYKDAMGVIEPSYVIKRFIDGSKINELVAYLEALHARDAHNRHHSIILVNCYARLWSRDKIRALMDTLQKVAETDKEEVAGVVQTLREAKLSVEAMGLAMRVGLPSAALAIIMEEMKKHGHAIKYIGELPAELAVAELEKYGRALKASQPDETVRLIGALLEKSDEDDSARLLQVLLAGETPGAGSAILESMADTTSSKTLDAVLVELRLREYKQGDELDVEEKLLRHVDKDAEEAVLRKAEEFMVDPAIEALLKRRDAKASLHSFYMKRNRIEEAVVMAMALKSNDIWLSTLHGISRSTNAIEDTTMAGILKGLKETSTIHPLVVLDILSRSSRIRVAAVKEHIISWLAEQKKQIDEDKRIIAACGKRIEDARKQTEQLQYNAQVFQVSKCSACNFDLQLPSLFFLCKHAFHRQCFDSYVDKDDVCPKCAGSPGAAAAKRIPSESVNLSYHDFTNAMNKASDCNEVISRYLRSGLFDTAIKSKSTGQTRLASPTSTGPSAVGSRHTSGSSTPMRAAPPKAALNPFDDDDDDSANPFEAKSTNPFD